MKAKRIRGKVPISWNGLLTSCSNRLPLPGFGLGRLSLRSSLRSALPSINIQRCSPGTEIEPRLYIYHTSIMPRKSPGNNIVVLERRLGFFTKLGLHRTAYSLWPAHVQQMLKRMDNIKKFCMDIPPDQLWSNQLFDECWKDLFFDVGQYLWPEPKEDAGVQQPADPEFYP